MKLKRTVRNAYIVVNITILPKDSLEMLTEDSSDEEPDHEAAIEDRGIYR